MKIEASVDLQPIDITRNYGREEIIDFICELDLAVAEIDFTVELVKRLKASLINDMSQEEIDDL